ncbi:MAG TPA: GNAT family N-acetyltransferase [Candidatus Angelobacter sp.]|nr:GNAT family N-acetyltransferase [Candidatus Angelobacter sp.]
MRVRLVPGAAEFLEATLALRAQDPVRTNVLGSVATGIRDGVRYDAESFFLAERDGLVVGAALWTVPFRLLVGPMDDEAAEAIGVAAVARAAELGAPLPGAVGPVRATERAAQATGRPWVRSRSERVLVLHQYLPPGDVPGNARRATDADVDLVRRWRREFATEIGNVVHDGEERTRQMLPTTWLWAVDGEVVSMAGHAPVVSTPSGDVGRIGPVYTPVEHRRHGYGGAVTAAVVEHLRAFCGTVMLYTDAANPTSNHVYESLGFVHEDDVAELRLEPL